MKGYFIIIPVILSVVGIVWANQSITTNDEMFGCEQINDWQLKQFCLTSKDDSLRSQLLFLGVALVIFLILSSLLADQILKAWKTRAIKYE